MFNNQLVSDNAFFTAGNTNTNSYEWNFGDGDSAVVSAVNVVHHYQQDGTYLVTLRVRNKLGCVNVYTDTVTIATTAVNLTNADAISVFCDGTSACNIFLPSATGYMLDVTDVTGKCVIKKQADGNFTLPIGSLPPGIYLLRLQNGGSVHVHKFAKL
jgi:PKD repeat protein